MAAKDYSQWGAQKAILNNRPHIPSYNTQEVWWTAVGCNIGSEEDGKSISFSRPVVVIQKFNDQFFLGIPLSTTPKNGRFYYVFKRSPAYQTALLSQVRAFDARRLLRRSGWIERGDFSALKQKLILLVGH